MNLERLQRRLASSFHPPAARGLDAVFRIHIDQASLTLQVVGGTLEFLGTDTRRPADATFHFADYATAWALFTGEADAFEAFMDERFSADGYLMWAFTLMAMFRSPSLPVAPVE